MSADTVSGRVLLAAYHLATETGPTPVPFSVAALVVRAWEMFPESFSLCGIKRKLPDSNAVIAKLSGADGLPGRGLLRRVGPRLYEVTPFGAAQARILGGAKGCAA